MAGRGRVSGGRRTAGARVAWLPVAAVLVFTHPAAAQGPDGREMYGAGCASCHGRDGRGPAPGGVAFDVPVPDFTECSFSSREPDADWFAVVHGGGPARAFDETMPAFGEAFRDEEIAAILDHVRGYCEDRAWPRGELNLPRALMTEKAYPEDEAVWTVGVAPEAPAAVTHELLYERRIGARNQVEIALPFAFRESATAGEGWTAGPGDVAVGVKRVLHHSLEGGVILSAAGEVKLPTGSRERGFGAGVVTFEPFLALGALLPKDAFFQVQAGAELPAGGEPEEEVFWRIAAGRTWTEGRYGRAWTPMVEVLAASPVDDWRLAWDLVPQLQVTLNRRQHVMLNVGARLPLTHAETRSTTLLAYLLWDWFDGGLFDGW